MDYVHAAKKNEIASGHMNGVTVASKKILIANLDGNYSAILDRHLPEARRQF